MSLRSTRQMLFFTSALALATASGLQAFAQVPEPTFQFDIPAESLTRALSEFSASSSQQLVFSEELIVGKNSSAVHGRFTAEQALKLLVAGAGLKVGVASNGVLMLKNKNDSATQNEPVPSRGVAQAAPEIGTETVLVTASRVAREGYVPAAPTTVVTSEYLQTGDPTNLGNALANLPSFSGYGSAGPNRVNLSAGQNIANLRDLGFSRTLTLVDGARPITTNLGVTTFGFDLAAIPVSIVQKVEVVTGGASAQWGSEAVSGVVNIVTNKNFEGFKVYAQDGSDTEGYGSNEFKTEIAYGTDFDGGRGHVMFGAGYDRTVLVAPASLSPTGRNGLITNPNYTSTCGCAQSLFATNLLNNDASTGGLITSGPLKGTNFGSGGSTSAFQYGQYGLLATSGILMIGGDPSARLFSVGSTLPTGSLIAPTERENFYGRASYNLTSDTVVSVDLLLDRNIVETAPFTDSFYLGSITIQNTNAYLPQQIVTAMAANNISSFAMGRINTDFGAITNAIANSSQQVKIGANGSLGDGWTWDAFYSYGATERRETVGNQPISANFTNAVNAVKSPTSGQPVCAITLTNPASPCVPVNLFGSGSPSAAAISYIEGSSTSEVTLWQHEVAANVRGEPFSLPAGPVSVASGFEYRVEGENSFADALTVAKAFSLTGAPYFVPGSYTVAEGYAEAVAPLLQNLPAIQELDLSAAGRVSGYSTSGTIPSWKVGLTDTASNDLSLRATVSRDIRAPNLAELDTLQTIGAGSVVANGTTYNVQTTTGGNPSLKPEVATSWTVGASYRPEWLSGFSFSADYYSTSVKNAIVSLSSQVIVNQCYTGNISAACAEITKSTSGAPTSIQSTYINLATYKLSGIDLEADYAADLSQWQLPGVISFKWLATYISYLKEHTGTTIIPLAGDEYGAETGTPRVRSTLVATYALDPVEVMMRARFVGGGAYSLQQVVNTSVSGQTYIDAGLQWKLPTEVNLTAYADVNNLFNNLNAVAVAANPFYFDPIGRTYVVGLKLGL